MMDMIGEEKVEEDIEFKKIDDFNNYTIEGLYQKYLIKF